MKTYLLILLSVLFLSCNNDDDSPANPVDELPPATKTGENTFGCLINGRPFTPRGVPFGAPSKGATYQYVYNPQNDTGHYGFQVFGNNFETDVGVALNLVFQNYEDLEEDTYMLSVSDSEQIGNMGAYIDTVGAFYTSESNIGYIYITKTDFENRIVSGTFEFDVDVNGEIYSITDGRFDFNF